MSRATLWLVALWALVTMACAPANERPLHGAQPGTEGATPAGAPPTLSSGAKPPTPAVVTQPSPGLVASASPSPVASPSVVSAPPIVRTIVPGANGHVPAGDAVTLSAVLVGRGADLATASMQVNGADAGAQIDKRTPREWTIHASQKLANGTYTARVLVRDASGLAGGFTWQFAVGEVEPSPAPTP